MSARSDDQVANELKAIDKLEGSPSTPNYNVAPTDTARIVVSRPLRDSAGQGSGDPVRQLRTARWGLLPRWAKDVKEGSRLFNARAESVSTKPAFRSAYTSRRCLVPIDGWYEWRVLDTPHGPRKQPYYMTARDGHVLTLAGLYEFWRDPSAPQSPTLTTCTILTTEAVGGLSEIHDRQPLVLSQDAWDRWLDAAVADPSDLLVPWDESAAERLELRPVSTMVNSVRNNGRELIARVEPSGEDAETLF